MIKKILFISLTNIGDAVLTLPALELLRQNFSEARITVIAGERSSGLFQDNPNIEKFIAYNKHSALREKLALLVELNRQRFDTVVDLRNSLFGLFILAKHKTSVWTIIPKQLRHMKDRHIYRVTGYRLQVTGYRLKAELLHISPRDEERVEKILRENNISREDNIIVIAPGGRSHIKRWPQQRFLELAGALIKERKVKIILTGDNNDESIAKSISASCAAVGLCGKLTLTQSASLLKKAVCVIANDSAISHLASYLNIPVVAIFGPTDEAKYGPWSQNSRLVKKDIACRPCCKAQCSLGTLDCLRFIKTRDVLGPVRDILDGKMPERGLSVEDRNFRRILIVRTDRIGDVVLSTPVIKALRDKYPASYIAMIVSPYSKEIAGGNPYLDEVIVYDKDAKHKSWRRTLKFAFNLKKRKFDIALVLHPSNRVHLITFFAGIRRRIGYNRKLGFLLTDRIEHTKQLGQRHESEYNLDFLRYLDIACAKKEIFIPLYPEAEIWAGELLEASGIKSQDKLLAIHPAASCPSKIWPPENFAKTADLLVQKYGFKVLIVAGPKDAGFAQAVLKNMRQPAVDLSAKASVSQLSALLKKCSLFISNDSGPVHIAAGLGVPVVSIFGRAQPGLGPKRWAPLTANSRILHKPAGCVECLAHNCVKDFQCLKAITVDDVVAAAESLLNRCVG